MKSGEVTIFVWLFKGMLAMCALMYSIKIISEGNLRLNYTFKYIKIENSF